MSFLQKIPEVGTLHSEDVGIMLVGSAAKKREKKPVDRDYVLVAEDKILARVIRSLESHPSYLGLSDDSHRLTLGETEYGLCALAINEFSSRIRNVLTTPLQLKDWSIGPVTPEGFCDEVENGIIERDTSSDLLIQCKTQLTLEKDSILSALLQDSGETIQSIIHKISANHGVEVFYVLRGELVFHLIRRWYLSHGVFCSGIKHFLQDREHLGDIDGLLKNIDTVLKIQSSKDLGDLCSNLTHE